MAGVKPTGEIYVPQFTPAAQRRIPGEFFREPGKVSWAGSWGTSYRTGSKPSIQETQIKRSKRRKVIATV